MTTHHKKNVITALLCCAAALGAAPPAEAAYIVVKADPTYGPAYPGLGWRASGALYVPDSCRTSIGTGTTTLTMATDSVCASAQLQDVKIHFYNVADPLTTVEILSVGTYLEDAGAVASVGDVSQELIDISFGGGNVTGLRTSLSTPLLSADLLAGDGIDRFALEFSVPGARLASFLPGGDTPNYFKSESQYEPTYTIGQWIEDRDYVREVDEPVVPTPRPVSEPGSVLLVLAALSAALLARRRA